MKEIVVNLSLTLSWDLWCSGPVCCQSVWGTFDWIGVWHWGRRLDWWVERQDGGTLWITISILYISLPFVLDVVVKIKWTKWRDAPNKQVQTPKGNVLTDLGPNPEALRGGYCYIPEFGILLLISLSIYGYDFILHHMITYLCSWS